MYIFAVSSRALFLLVKHAGALDMYLSIDTFAVSIRAHILFFLFFFLLVQHAGALDMLEEEEERV